MPNNSIKATGDRLVHFAEVSAPAPYFNRCTNIRMNTTLQECHQGVSLSQVVRCNKK